MIKKLFLITSIITGLMVLGTFVAHAIDGPVHFRLGHEYQRKVFDVNKKSEGDLSCVAASMANAMTFSLDGDLSDAKIYYREFRRLFGKRGINFPDAWSIAMDSIAKSANKEYVHPFEKYQFFSMYDVYPDRFFEQIYGSLVSGNVIMASVDFGNENYSHAITIWGIRKFANGHVIIEYTDSDDKETRVRIAGLASEKGVVLFFDMDDKYYKETGGGKLTHFATVRIIK